MCVGGRLFSRQLLVARAAAKTVGVVGTETRDTKEKQRRDLESDM